MKCKLCLHYGKFAFGKLQLNIKTTLLKKCSFFINVRLVGYFMFAKQTFHHEVISSAKPISLIVYPLDKLSCAVVSYFIVIVSFLGTICTYVLPELSFNSVPSAVVYRVLPSRVSFSHLILTALPLVI